MNPVFCAESIGKSFGRRQVLSSAGLWAWPGQVTALVGRNGSGKTTLLNLAVGRLESDSGMVIFRDQRVERPRLSRLAARGLFYLPDRGLLSAAFSLRRHFEAVRHHFPEASVASAVAALRLEDLLERRPGSLSVGERRRAEVALALARDPACLLADEPFLELMPTDAETLAGVLRELAGRGAALVITGHQVPLLFEIADHVIWLTAGTTHALGSPDEARRHDQFRREYLGPEERAAPGS